MEPNINGIGSDPLFILKEKECVVVASTYMKQSTMVELQVYDRLWTRDVLLANGTIQVSSDTLVSSGLTDDNPPPAVLKTAITSTAPNPTIHLYLALPSVKFSLSFYLNFYFSEIIGLKPNETRSFNVFKDNAPFSTPISPPYKNCTEINAGNISV